ncbi:hypothetical protein PMAC_001117 [Pneumocystis sp. 'macacae']|nr:hypothetical protein PMAC_001117 [Pneumocystis sp. 'macacae']
MTSISNISHIPKKQNRRRRSMRRTSQPTKPVLIAKKNKLVHTESPQKDNCTTMDISKPSLHMLQDLHSQKLLEMLNNHFHDLQRTTHERYKNDIFSLSEETIQNISTTSVDPVFQHMQHELENAQLDRTFILNQEQTLQQAQKRLSICLETYIKEAKKIQTEIQTLLLPTGPFELADDTWTDAEALLEQVNMLTDKYLHKMKDSMQVSPQTSNKQQYC